MLIRPELAVAAFSLTAPAFGAPSNPARSTIVMFRATDGVLVHGVLYAAKRPKALILLFHQAGSSKAEYASIAPRLVAAGYSALAIDQRSGGSLFGPNLTAAGTSRATTFLDARKDVEAAVAWARPRKLPIALWGSSYSAALVFLVAADHPDIKAVVAFSPGEYLGSPVLVRMAASRLHMPIYVTSASDAQEEQAARAILAAAPATLKEQDVPSIGVHGSSTLIQARDPKGAATNWNAVMRFLRTVFT